jgi:sugar lactone lactonase YvrE
MQNNSPVFSQCLDLETKIGEGPVWDDETGLLWFVDILAPALFSYHPDTGALARYDMPDQVTSIGLTTDARLILSLRTAVYFFTPATQQLDLFVTPDVGAPVNRLNDGKVGPDGCFWVGSMHETRPAMPTAALFRITPDGKCDKYRSNLRVSNGLAWSPDHRRMYHSDSRGPSITGYDFDARTGAMSNPQILARPDEATGLPDGAAVDSLGNYWSAGLTAGCLNVFSPEGILLRRIALPLGAPTMPCFGGPDMRTLFVTGLTRMDGDRVVARGGLISGRVDVAGAPVARFGAPFQDI